MYATHGEAMPVADVQWIKIKVGMFDGESFKKIKRAKIGGEKFRDKLTAVWFELMDFAGKCNHGGAFINSREIPFPDLESIAAMIDRDTDELELCMSFFINEGMVEIIDNVYQLSNWCEYQNMAGLDKIRESNKARQAKFRENKRLKALAEASEEDSNVTCNVTERYSSISPSDSNSVSEKNNEGDCKGEKKQTRHKYGEYNNVLLTDEELEKLKTEFPDWKERIERLSSYIAQSGKSYKSHLATIRNWARKDKERGNDAGVDQRSAENPASKVGIWL
jgi:predicted phage replisome organizer